MSCLGMGATCRIQMTSALISIALLTCKLHVLFVCTWLGVVAKLVDFDECVAAAVESL